MNFTDYLEAETEDTEIIFKFYLEYLLNFSSKDFTYEDQLQLKGIVLKFSNCIHEVSYFEKERREKFNLIVENLIKQLKSYRRIKRKSSPFLHLFNPLRKDTISHVQETFEELYSMSIELITETKKRREYKTNSLELNGFYLPQNSNKEEIKKLINEAINLIHTDNSITEKTKKNIIEYLELVLKRLEREHVNWSTVIGNIKETIIVLGALGSFVGGLSPLFEAKQKLEETSTVIQKTSVNLNFNTINKTFNINNIEKIGEINSAIILLNEENKNNDE